MLTESVSRSRCESRGSEGRGKLFDDEDEVEDVEDERAPDAGGRLRWGPLSVAVAESLVVVGKKGFGASSDNNNKNRGYLRKTREYGA